MHHHHLHNASYGIGAVLGVWFIILVVFIGLIIIWARPSKPQPPRQRTVLNDVLRDYVDDRIEARLAEHSEALFPHRPLAERIHQLEVRFHEFDHGGQE